VAAFAFPGFCRPRRQKRIADAPQVFAQGFEVLRRAPHRRRDLRWDRLRLAVQRMAFCGHCQADAALVPGVPGALDKAHSLKPFQKRCQRARIEEQTFADLLQQ